MAERTKVRVAADVPVEVATEAPLGDLGRRLTARRVKLGLTRRQVAARAGMAVTYLRYLEEHPGAGPGTSALMQLAEALETTVSDLTGGAVDLPPGTGRAGHAPQFTWLRPSEWGGSRCPRPPDR